MAIVEEFQAQASSLSLFQVKIDRLVNQVRELLRFHGNSEPQIQRKYFQDQSPVTVKPSRFS